MTARTERHLVALTIELTGEGRTGMPEEGTE